MVRFSGPALPWKNSEDEVLKAAVMKYGLNQWGRVASLFSKRTAKQCRTRWNEWLSPTVRKTEWSRDEDEKLLHFAKLMPTQWRTIAPLIGRTAAQCLARYETLLDEAAGMKADGDDDIKAEAPIEAAAAKPDAVDMDEEELEMLAEARARLANTLGKKAKRKAREKLKAEMLRVAKIQKRRELKSGSVAGTSSSSGVLHTRHKRKKGADAEDIDYTVEVPFELPVPAGPHDVSLEMKETNKHVRNDMARLARMQQTQSAATSTTTKKRVKKAPSTRKTEAMLAAFVERKTAESLATSTSARPKLSIPAPRVSDHELEEIAKLVAPSAAASGSHGAMLPPPLPASRSLTAPKRNIAMEEARNQVARNQANNPLTGMDVVGMSSPMETGTGFQGAKPSSSMKRQSDASSVAMSSVAMTSLPSLASRRTFIGAGGRVGVLRDELGINRFFSGAASFEDGDEPADAAELAEQAVMSMDKALASIPKPVFKVETKMVGEDQDNMDEDVAPLLSVDASDREKMQRERMERKRTDRLAQRPTAIQRGLPSVPPPPPAWLNSKETSSSSSIADKLVAQELQAILNAGSSATTQVKLPADIQDELTRRVHESVLAGMDSNNVPVDYLDWALWGNNDGESMARSRARFAAAVAARNEIKERADAAEVRANESRTEFQKQTKEALKRTNKAWRDLGVAEIEYSCFLQMFERESITGPRRLDNLRDQVKKLQDEERQLQKIWAGEDTDDL